MRQFNPSRRRVFQWLFLALLVVGVLLGAASVNAALNDAVVYYSFDDADIYAGTNQSDLSGNGNDMIDNTATTGAAGVLNEGYQYVSASSDRSILDESADLVFSAGDNITIAGWFKTSTTGAYQTVFSYRPSGGNPNMIIQIQNSDVLRFFWSDSSGNGRDISTSYAVTDGSWYHYCARVGSSNSLRINGAANGTSSTAQSGSLSYNNPSNTYDYWPFGTAFSLTSNELNGYQDEFGIWDRHLSNSECDDLYNSGAGFNPYTDSVVNATISAEDSYTGSSLTNFTATWNGTNYTTTNGTVTLPILTNTTSLWNLTYYSNESGGYFSRAYEDVNLSSTHTGSLHQAEITFNASNRVSGAAVAGFTASTSSNGGSASVSDGVAMNLSAANDYVASFSKSGYYGSTTTFDTSPLEVKTESFSVYDHVLNLSINVLGGTATDQNFTADVYSRDYSFHEQASTTNGYIEFNLTDGNYTVYINDSIHALTAENVTLNTSTNLTDLSVDLYTTNSVFVEFRDEETGALVDDRNVTAFFTGSIESYNYTTDNGTLYIELIEPQNYTITYDASGYEQREYFFTLTNRTTNNIVLYMLNESEDTIVTVTVTNTLNQELSGAVVYAQKKNLSGTNYYTVESCTTNGVGECILRLVLNDVTYRFSVTGSDGEDKTFKSTGTTVSDDQKVFSSELTLVIDEQDDNVEAVFNRLQISGDVSYSNASEEFTFTWNDPSGLSITACLEVVRRIGGGFTTINTSCSASSAGTVTQAINTSVGDEFIGTGYVLDDGDKVTIDVESVVLTEFAVQVGVFGLFLFGFFIAGIAAFSGLFNPVVGPSLLVATLFFASYLGFISLGLAAFGVIGSLLVLVIYMVRT